MTEYKYRIKTETILVDVVIYGTHAKIKKTLHEKPFTLTWNDGVANEWTEDYDTLSLALLRLGTLMKCGESDWDEGFRFDEKEFAENAQAFLNYATN